jgi:hypothetical protein
MDWIWKEQLMFENPDGVLLYDADEGYEQVQVIWAFSENGPEPQTVSFHRAAQLLCNIGMGYEYCLQAFDAVMAGEVFKWRQPLMTRDVIVQLADGQSDAVACNNAKAMAELEALCGEASRAAINERDLEKFRRDAAKAKSWKSIKGVTKQLARVVERNLAQPAAF